MANESRDGTGTQRAREAPSVDVALEELVHSREERELRIAALNPRLTEDLALALLNRRELPAGVIEDLARNQAVMKHRKVLIALVRHQHTPRHVSVPVMRRLYTFELLQLTLFPALAADLRVAMEQTLIARLESITAGERLTLAHRGPGGLMGALLHDKDDRVIRAALENSALTEDRLVRALMSPDAPEALILAVCRHSKWSLRRDIRTALLLNPNTPLAQLLALAQSLPVVVLRDLLQHTSMDSRIKSYLEMELERR
ncbi:MAG: hypothetical protein AB7O65_00015 [Candidatus Korobacteraceae bacterium]